MEQPGTNIHDDFFHRTAKLKPGLFQGRADSDCFGERNQPRVRERIMKLSLVYSATCHHRYWSER